jgi:hypothetical protein
MITFNTSLDLEKKPKIAEKTMTEKYRIVHNFGAFSKISKMLISLHQFMSFSSDMNHTGYFRSETFVN